MTIPYRTRRTLKRTGIALLIIAAVALVAWMIWILWVGRFVVYTREKGAVLNFDLPAEMAEGELAVPPTQGETVGIYYNEGDDAITTNKELTQLNGYYISAEVLEKDGLDTVKEQLAALPENTPVMIDVKSIKGNFFYSSQVGAQRNEALDIEGMDALFQYLNEKGFYTIARLPALRDFHYGLNHVPDGLPTAGGYLWIDQESCYWLNPASDGTRNYLIQIIQELQGLGFDEVVFYDFYFPATEEIVFPADKNKTLAETAQLLVDTCTTSDFAVSFAKQAQFTTPQGRSRVYLYGVEAMKAATVAKESGIANPQVNLVFVTDVHDTRFDAFGVLRPLAGAH